MRGKKGFTLIELVVVIAVLGILAAIGIPRMVESFKISRGHRMIADLRLLDSAIAFYTAQHGEPPESLAVLAEEPQIIAAVPEKLGADFIVKQNSGTEKEYTGAESWNYGINPETNRAYYGGSGQENQNIEFYLFGESSGGSGGSRGKGLAANFDIINTLVKQYRDPTGVDSNGKDKYNDSLWTGINTPDNAYCEQLKEMGITACALQVADAAKHGVFALTTVDFPYDSSSNTKLVPVMYVRWDAYEKQYLYMAVVGAVNSGVNGDIGTGWNEGGEKGAEAKSTRTTANYTTSYESALARYENLVKGYNEGLLTATRTDNKYTPDYVVDEQGNVTKK